MRKFFLVIGCVLMICMCVSCSHEQGTTTMKLVLKSDFDRTRRMGAVASLDIVKYVVSGVGPRTSAVAPTFSVQVTDDTVSIPGLVLGNWDITVTGLDSSGIEIAKGVTSVKLTSRPGPVTVYVNQPIGEGSFCVNVQWNASVVKNPVIKAWYRGPDTSLATEIQISEDDIVIDKEEGIAYLNAVSLTTGSYVLRVMLYNGSDYIGGAIDIIEIINGLESNGLFDFTDRTVTFDMNIGSSFGKPIKGSLIRYTDGICSVGEEVEFGFRLDRENLISGETYYSEWFLDGVPLTNAQILGSFNDYNSYYAADFTEGMHTMSVIAYNTLLGSVSCFTTNFQIVAPGSEGMLYKGALYDSSTVARYLTTNSDCITGIGFGYYAVLDPEEGCVRVIYISNTNELNIFATYSAEYLKEGKRILGKPGYNAFAVIDGCGNLEDEENHDEAVTYFMLYEDEYDVRPLLDPKEGELARYWRVPGYLRPFGEFTDVAFMPTEDDGHGNVLNYTMILEACLDTNSNRLLAAFEQDSFVELICGSKPSDFYATIGCDACDGNYFAIAKDSNIVLLTELCEGTVDMLKNSEYTEIEADFCPLVVKGLNFNHVLLADSFKAALFTTKDLWTWTCADSVNCSYHGWALDTFVDYYYCITDEKVIAVFNKNSNKLTPMAYTESFYQKIPCSLISGYDTILSLSSDGACEMFRIVGADQRDFD